MNKMHKTRSLSDTKQKQKNVLEFLNQNPSPPICIQITRDGHFIQIKQLTTQ